MIIIGWGRSTAQLAISETQRLLLNYGYFRLFWVFGVTFGNRYSLATLGQDGWATRSIGHDAAGQLVGGKPPQPAFWWRWGLLFLAGAVAIIVIIAVINTVVSGA